MSEYQEERIDHLEMQHSELSGRVDDLDNLLLDVIAILTKGGMDSSSELAALLPADLMAQAGDQYRDLKREARG